MPRNFAACILCFDSRGKLQVDVFILGASLYFDMMNQCVREAKADRRVIVERLTLRLTFTG